MYEFAKYSEDLADFTPAVLLYPLPFSLPYPVSSLPFSLPFLVSSLPSTALLTAFLTAFPVSSLPFSLPFLVCDSRQVLRGAEAPDVDDEQVSEHGGPHNTDYPPTRWP